MTMPQSQSLRDPRFYPHIVDGAVAGGFATVLSGVPSTVYTLATGRDLLEPVLAAGSLLLPRERRPGPLLLAAVPVHLALSFGWAVALALVLPGRRPLATAVAAGVGIAALDLGIVGRRFPRIASLPQSPQVADHLTFGLVVGAVVRRRRARREEASRRFRHERDRAVKAAA